MTDIETRARAAAKQFGADFHFHFISQSGNWTVAVGDNVILALGHGSTMEEALDTITPVAPEPKRRRRRASEPTT